PARTPATARDAFAYDEIGWIAADLGCIALRHGVDAAALGRGAVVADAHRDAEPLRRLASHPRLVRPARALIGGPVVIATTLLCIDVAHPVRLPIADAVLATVFLDTLQAPGMAKSLFGRFGSVSVRRLDEVAADEIPGRSFRVVYVAAAASAAWPAARPADAIGDGDLWPAAHLAFG
ncbi:MAG: hypothetical protein IT561_07170, partial [Alphaproteobacteria bacterium]|nr:hypothetical protein [Alphaproteobacteria bacterium]